MRRDVLDSDIPKDRQILAISSILIKHRSVNRCAVHMIHHTVRKNDLLNHSPAFRIRFKPKRIRQIRTAETIVHRKHMADSSTHLTSESNSAVTIRKLIVLDQNILARLVRNSSVPISTGF